MKYLFIFPQGVTRNLFRSQLEPIIDFLAKKDHLCFVYFGPDVNYHLIGNNYSLIESKTELKYILSQVDLVYLRSRKDFFPIYLSKILRKRHRYKILYNFRGFGSYEGYYVQKNIFKFIISISIEFFIYRLSDYVSVVSTVFKDELKSHFGSKREISVIPCCVSQINQKKIRNDNLMKFVYCGSTVKWQKFEEIIGLYFKIHKVYKNSQLTIFTKDIEIIRDYLKNKDNANIFIKFLPRQELLQELTNHDFGFLLRDNVKLNNVASPIKFAEYLSSGLIPIISPGIGDYSKLVATEKIGIVTDEYFNINLTEIETLFSNRNLPAKIFSLAEGLTWKKNLNVFPTN